MDYTSILMDLYNNMDDSMAIVFLIVLLAITIFYIIGLMKVFEKAGRKKWEAIIPFYKTFVLLKMVGLPFWLGVIYCLIYVFNINAEVNISIINTAISWIIFYCLARKFDKSVLFSLGTAVFPKIFVPILAFSKAQYRSFDDKGRTRDSIPSVPTSMTQKSNVGISEISNNGIPEVSYGGVPEVNQQAMDVFSGDGFNDNVSQGQIPNMNSVSSAVTVGGMSWKGPMNQTGANNTENIIQKPDLMASNGTSTMNSGVKPDLMAPNGTVPKPDLMASSSSVNTVGSTPLETMYSTPVMPADPSSIPVYKNIGNKEEIAPPTFDPFSSTPTNFISSQENNSQNPQ